MPRETNATDAEPLPRFMEYERDLAGSQSVVMLKTPWVMARPHLLEGRLEDDARTIAPSHRTP